MIDSLTVWQALIVAYLCATVLSALVWGVQPYLRSRRLQALKTRERVRFSSDVHTAPAGIEHRPNRAGYWLGALLWALLVALFGHSPLLIGAATALFATLFWRKLFVESEFHTVQRYAFTDRGIWIFPARHGLPVWKKPHEVFVSWRDVDAYKIEGVDLLLHRDEQFVVRLSFKPTDYERLLGLLADRELARMEVSDRIWVAQFDEHAFYEWEEEISRMGWNLLDLYADEFEELHLVPEFGVMRNMPGNRLLDEYARSWLQLNVLDIDTHEKRLTSTFALWHSNGALGQFTGLRGQELVDALQEWFRRVLQESAALGQPDEEVVS